MVPTRNSNLPGYPLGVASKSVERLAGEDPARNPNPAATAARPCRFQSAPSCSCSQIAEEMIRFDSQGPRSCVGWAFVIPMKHQASGLVLLGLLAGTSAFA